MNIPASIKTLFRKPRNFPFSGIGTLLLSDISGIDIAAGVSAIELAAVINRNCKSVNESILDCGGFTLQNVEDATLAVWGPSFSSPSHAEIALKTAKKILIESQRIQRETGFSFQIRIALATGKMTADFIGNRPQVVGSPVTTVQRLLELKVPRRSQLFYTSETLEFVSDRSAPDPIAKIRGCSGQDVPVFEFSP